MLYADVRGSTQLAARMGPTEFAALMQRFFQTAIKVFTWTDAIVDKMVGDEVIGIYVPCLTGPDYQRAVERAKTSAGNRSRGSRRPLAFDRRGRAFRRDFHGFNRR